MSLHELENIHALTTKFDRFPRVGEIIRHTPSYCATEKVVERGVGIVVNTDHPFFEVYWVGEKKFWRLDGRNRGSYILLDIELCEEAAKEALALR